MVLYGGGVFWVLERASVCLSPWPSAKGSKCTVVVVIFDPSNPPPPDRRKRCDVREFWKRKEKKNEKERGKEKERRRRRRK